MIKYIIIDNYDLGFCQNSWTEPLTRHGILQKFFGFSEEENMGIKKLNFAIIAEIWKVRIAPVDIPLVLCPECKCPMRRDKCPACKKQWVCTI
jgi:hypothetical protein